ncbi:MAG TPA: glycosyltransferase family 4 protein [Polyangiaceae bacterium]|nr:glycosyltransferase family 4 protein [Polyangiaceae bacterium]
MKVLFIVFEFQNIVAGGLGRVINGVAPELAALCDLHVLTVFRHPWWLHQLQLWRYDGQTPRKVGRPVLDTPANFARLLLAEGRFDAVHFFYANERIMTTKAEIVRSRFPDTKLVFSVHNLFKHEHRVRPCGATFLRAEAQMLALVDHVHVLNRACLRIFEQAYPEIAATRALSVVHNGIDDASFRSRDTEFASTLRARIPAGSKIVVCLSRWAPGKGLEHLLDAMAELCAERDDVTLVIAGRKLFSWETGSFSYVRAIDRRRAALGRRVIALGWLGVAQRNALFGLADVAVMPSELEYFPYGSTEPLHEDVPLVQSRLPCLEEFLSHGEHCWFFEPGNARDLAANLRIALADPDAARRVGAAGGQLVRGLLRWPVIARQYRALYERRDGRETRPDDAGEASAGPLRGAR